MHLHELSIHAWKNAAGTLPIEGLTPQEEQLKQHFEEGLKLAEEGLAAIESRSMAENRLLTLPDLPEKLPWIRALAMEGVLTANNVLNTSVSIIFVRYSASST